MPSRSHVVKVSTLIFERLFGRQLSWDSIQDREFRTTSVGYRFDPDAGTRQGGHLPPPNFLRGCIAYITDAVFCSVEGL